MVITVDVSNNKITQSIQSIRRANEEYRKVKSAYQAINHKADHFLSLVKAENDRDRRRLKQDRHDKSHDKWMNITGFVSVVTPFVVAGAAMIALQAGQNQNETLPLYVYTTAATAAALTSATRGKGFFALKVQKPDFAQKNGEHHDKRRGRAYDIEVLTKMRCFKEKNAIREENDRLILGRLYAWHKWMLKGKIRNLDKKKKNIDKYIIKMEKRDEKVSRKEHKDGKEPSFDFNRIEAKKAAFKRLKEDGVPEELIYQLIDSEGELPRQTKVANKRNVTTILSEAVDKVPIAKRIRKKRKMKEATPFETVFEGIGRQMLKEECYNWSDLSDKLAEQLDRFEEKVANS